MPFVDRYMDLLSAVLIAMPEADLFALPGEPVTTTSSKVVVRFFYSRIRSNSATITFSHRIRVWRRTN